MFLLLTVVVFLSVIAGGAAIGLKIYVRPKEALERVTGSFEAEQSMPAHPSLAFHDLIKRIGIENYCQSQIGGGAEAKS